MSLPRPCRLAPAAGVGSAETVDTCTCAMADSAHAWAMAGEVYGGPVVNQDVELLLFYT